MAEQTHQDDGGRAQREARFHDVRFSHGDGERSSGRFYVLTGPSRADLTRRIDEITAPARVLELGCGADSAAWDLLERGIDVTGIDISTAAIDLARDEAHTRDVDPDRFCVMNAESLEFSDASFDAVLGSSILHHLDLDRALAEIRRVLRPGGRAIFYEPLGKNPGINLYRRLTPTERSEDEHPLTPADLDQLRDVFDQVELEYFHLSSLAALPLRRTRAFAPAARFLERLDQRLFARVDALRELAWVVVIEASADNG